MQTIRHLTTSETLTHTLLHRLVDPKTRRLNETDSQELAQLCDANERNKDFAVGLVRLLRASSYSRVLGTNITSIFDKDCLSKRLKDVTEFLRNVTQEVIPDSRTIDCRAETLRVFSEDLKLEGLKKEDFEILLPEKKDVLNDDNQTIHTFVNVLFSYFLEVDRYFNTCRNKELPIEAILQAREETSEGIKRLFLSDPIKESLQQRIPDMEKFACKVLGIESL